MRNKNPLMGLLLFRTDERRVKMKAINAAHFINLTHMSLYAIITSERYISKQEYNRLI